MALGAKFGRQRAHEMVYEVCMKAFETDAPLKEGLLEHPEIGPNLTSNKINEMLDPHIYTGLAESFVDRVLALARRESRGNRSAATARRERR
jgi:adenylosuccinate lyase